MFVRKDGPAQSDVHIDAVNQTIGAIHPFMPLDSDGAMCAKCGLTRSSHKSVAKGAGWDTLGPDPTKTPVKTCPKCQGTGGQNAWDANNSCETCGGLGWLEDLEAKTNNNMATPPSPMLYQSTSPSNAQADDPQNPMLQGGNGTMEPSLQAPAAFHEPINPTGPPNMSKRALNQKPTSSDPMADQSSGSPGEWSDPKGGNFVPAGQAQSAEYTQRNAWDPPRDPMGNLRQDGPIHGAANPGRDPGTQIDSQWGGQDNKPITGPKVHNLTQCPQCGVALTGTEKDCPNAWCGHDLQHDTSASYDAWSS